MNLTKEQTIINDEIVSINDADFWDKLEKSDNSILKFNPNGDYNQTFNTNQKNFLKYLHDLPEITNINVGDIVTGNILSISNREMVIDIDFKDSIYVPINATDHNIISDLNIGDEIKVMVIKINDNPFELIGSVTELIKKEVFRDMETYYNENTPFKAKVTDIIPAGFTLNIEKSGINIKAFMPNFLAGVNRLRPEQVQDMLNKEIYVMLETLQKDKGVYVVSRKKYLQSLISDEVKKLKKETIYTGVVTGSKDFGVFVEFNQCLTGLIHKHNLVEMYQDKIEDIVPGTEIEVYVKDILKNNKIILSQNLNESLWDTIKIGQKFEGKVRVIKPFGILVDLDNETTGLIRKHRLTKSTKQYNAGDIINVKVTTLFTDDRKMFLDFV